MPRYSQMTPTFTPVSFEQYLKPLEAYVDTYNTLSADVDNTRGIIDTIPQFLDANNEGDRELINVYNNFQGDIDKVGTAIANGNLKDMMNLARGLKTRYNRELAPIATAYQQKQAAIKAFDEKKAKDSSWIGADPRSRSVKDYLNGANPSDFGVSGDALYKDAMTDAAAQSSRNVSVSDWNLSDDLQKQYFLRAIETGFRGDAVDDAIQAITSGSNVTREEAKDVFDYIKNAMGRIGSSYNTQNLSGSDRATANLRILNGIMAGLGYKYTDDHLKNEKDEQYWLNVEGKRLQNQIARKQLDALNNTEEEVEEYYGITPHFIINGDVSREGVLRNTLADIKAGKVKLEDKTGDKVWSEYQEDPMTGRKLPVGKSDETYLDRIYELSKGLGLTDSSVSKEDFAKSVTSQNVDDIIKTLEDTIQSNSQMYGQYWANQATSEMATRYVNSANSSFVDAKDPTKAKQGSLITKVGRNGKKEGVTTLPSQGTFNVPLPSQGTDLLFISTDDKNGGEYHVHPSVYNGATIIYTDENNRTSAITVEQAIKAYHKALNDKDGMRASILARNILQVVNSTTEGARKQQGKTIPQKEEV